MIKRLFKYATTDTARAILRTGTLRWSAPELFNDSHAIWCILYAFDGQAQNVPREPDHTRARYHVRNWQLRTLRVHAHCRGSIAPLAIICGRMEYFYISADERISV
jgi:hypothetical protein